MMGDVTVDKEGNPQTLFFTNRETFFQIGQVFNLKGDSCLPVRLGHLQLSGLLPPWDFDLQIFRRINT